jgi:hypothetical protein
MLVAVPGFESVDGSFTADLAFTKFFKPNFGVLGKQLMSGKSGESRSENVIH